MHTQILNELSKLIATVLTVQVGIFIVKILLGAVIKAVADPLIKLFFNHAVAYGERLGHSALSPKDCRDCEPLLKSLPN